MDRRAERRNGSFRGLASSFLFLQGPSASPSPLDTASDGVEPREDPFTALLRLLPRVAGEARIDRLAAVRFRLRVGCSAASKGQVGRRATIVALELSGLTMLPRTPCSYLIDGAFSRLDGRVDRSPAEEVELRSLSCSRVELRVAELNVASVSSLIIDLVIRRVKEPDASI